MKNRRLQLAILAQSLQDALRYDLAKSIVGAAADEREDLYEDALVDLSKYPDLLHRLKKVPPQQKRVWLKRITQALES